MGRRIPIETRLEAKIEKTADCWLWTGLLTYNGYGQFVYQEGRGADRRMRCMMAHRAVYQVHVRLLRDGETLDHLCMNRQCVNPEHLEPVTIGENIRRAPRSVSETCKYGHLYRDQSSFYKSKGARRCHKCHAEKEAKRRIVLSHSKI